MGPTAHSPVTVPKNRTSSLRLIAPGSPGRRETPTGTPEQLAVIPAPFRVVGGVELQHTIAGLGRRLLDAS